MVQTQLQIIQSLGDAMNWLEKELSWGTPIGELRHLNGRIGELYVALITNGRMAEDVNQKGYDVMSKEGERISVKTTSMSKGSGFVSFNPNTLDQVDRIMVLRINEHEREIEVLLDEKTSEARKMMAAKPDTNGKLNIALSKINKLSEEPSGLQIIKEAIYNDFTLQEMENGSVQVLREAKVIIPAKPELRKIAKALNINTLNQNGVEMNTRQMGTIIIRALDY